LEDLKLADLVEFRDLVPGIGDRDRLPAHAIPGAQPMLRLGGRADRDEDITLNRASGTANQ